MEWLEESAVEESERTTDTRDGRTGEWASLLTKLCLQKIFHCRPTALFCRVRRRSGRNIQDSRVDLYPTIWIKLQLESILVFTHILNMTSHAALLPNWQPVRSFIKNSD